MTRHSGWVSAPLSLLDDESDLDRLSRLIDSGSVSVIRPGHLDQLDSKSDPPSIPGFWKPHHYRYGESRPSLRPRLAG